VWPCRIIDNQVLLLWEWLSATIESRQPAFAEGYGGHEMPLPQNKIGSCLCTRLEENKCSVKPLNR
jgi:hypothetical protein